MDAKSVRNMQSYSAVTNKLTAKLHHVGSFIYINYEIFPLINGFSGSEGQIIILHVLQNKPHEYQPYFRRNFNKCTTAELKNSLSYVTWDLVFERDNVNTFAASYLNTQGLNNSCFKSPASTLVDLTFQSRALRSFSLNQLRNLSLQAGNLHSSFSISS